MDTDADGRLTAVRIGLGYVRGVRRREIEQLVAARGQEGRFRTLAELASRTGAGSPSLELLAWSGACDLLADLPGHKGARRLTLWQLGIAVPGRSVPGGTQLSLPLGLPAPPDLRRLSAWEAMLADYGTTGLTADQHPLALLRPGLPENTVTSTDLDRLRHGTRVRVGGLVVARQRPGTANGVVFILLEDEHGTINLIVPPVIYERYRLLVRTEPLVLVAGKLERFAAAGGAINVLVDQIGPLAAPERPQAVVKDFSSLDELERRRIAADRQALAGDQREGVAVLARVAIGGAAKEPATEAEDFRAVAPAVMSFGSGRRR